MSTETGQDERMLRLFPWQDRYFLILCLLCLLDLLALLPGLVPRDLTLAYGFMDGDSYDWIANGLRLAGADVRYSGRSPLLPLVIALLDRLSALRLLPLLLQGLFLSTILAFYTLAARLVLRRAAFASALALLACFSLGNLSLQVMADVPCSCLLLLAVRSFGFAGEDRRRYLAGGLWAGLAALTQSVGALWVPAAAATVLIHRRRDLRSPWLWAGLLAAPVLVLLGGAIHPLAVNGAGLAQEQWRLVAFHTGSMAFYLYSLASLLGLPGALLMLAGGALALRAARRDACRCLTLVLLASLASFFVFLYDFQSKRFLVYGVWLGGLLIAEALARARHRAAFGAAAFLLISCAVLPLPTTGSWPAWAAVWPAPPLYLEAPAGATAATGSSTLDLRSTRLSRLPVATALAASNPALAWRDAARPFPGAVDPRRFAADRSAIYLYADLRDEGGRYLTLTRLGSVLRKRVKCVPADYLTPYWPLITLEPAGSVTADYELFRARLPGLSGTWLLAVDGRGPLRPRLAALAGRAPAAVLTEPLARERDTAEAIRRFVGGHDGFVALIPYRRRAHLSQLYLPFVLPATDLFVLDAEEGRQLLARLTGAPVAAEARLGPATVRRTEYLGRKTSVISYLPPGAEPMP
jgi:4-amino-4-deoxy-L-arabinose transferase-like glycosyltransferase